MCGVGVVKGGGVIVKRSEKLILKILKLAKIDHDIGIQIKSAKTVRILFSFFFLILARKIPRHSWIIWQYLFSEFFWLNLARIFYLLKLAKLGNTLQ